MAGHSRPKDGVASARLCPAIHVFSSCGKDVDARHKAEHDELYQLILESSSHGISYTTILSAMPRSAASFWIGLIACF